MTEVNPGTDPDSASSPAEYVTLLRALKDRSGLTFRQIERQAESLGETLPRSTAASMLTRTTLPRAELVSALLKACGENDETVRAWLHAYDRLASQAPARSQAAEPEQPHQGAPVTYEERPKRRWAWPVGAAAVVLVAVAVVVPMLFTADRSEDEPHAISPKANPAAPAEGSYLIRAVHSNLCLSERAGSDSGSLYQKNCADTLPRFSLDRLNDGSYRIRTDHPDYGPGCTGVRKGGMSVDGVVSDGECNAGNAELYNLESAGTAGFHIRALHSNLCLGVVNGSKDEWANVRQVVCDSPTSGTVFAFDPVKP
ncbi:hypothetical protein [Allokutzneria oryzae]|uniref:XRE family transcriptional regulator n=1 Tax=Allokutzneria oryzae TaxID=1378989 RepID=A0ABV5ZYY3_9PSEU